MATIAIPETEAIRGLNLKQPASLTYTTLQQRIPGDHPRPALRRLVETALVSRDQDSMGNWLAGESICASTAK